MAVVVKCMKGVGATIEDASKNVSMFEKRMFLNTMQTTAEDEGVNVMQSPISKREAQRRGLPPQLKKAERGVNGIIRDVDLDSLPSYPSDEEVIGIITMEDVMEELLQEEILDETDEYVDVHNKIRINMQPPRRLSPRSSGGASITNLQWQTPVASPLSSYHHTPILRSPLSPYIQCPGPTPTLSSSPAKSFLGSPHEVAGPDGNSPASHRVSRKPYEKLQKLDV